MIDSAAKLREGLAPITPSNGQFREAFVVAQASNAKLARYYLRTMEDVNNGVRDSGFDATNDPERFDLEHVMPRKPEPGWQVDEDTISRYANRIGNLAMLKKGDNSTVRSKPFAEKREAYTRSGFALAKMILSEAEWTPGQSRLAR